MEPGEEDVSTGLEAEDLLGVLDALEDGPAADELCDAADDELCDAADDELCDAADDELCDAADDEELGDAVTDEPDDPDDEPEDEPDVAEAPLAVTAAETILPVAVGEAPV